MLVTPTTTFPRATAPQHRMKMIEAMGEAIKVKADLQNRKLHTHRSPNTGARFAEKAAKTDMMGREPDVEAEAAKQS
jgi:hypothetical protein